jgi:hypothetical protein
MSLDKQADLKATLEGWGKSMVLHFSRTNKKFMVSTTLVYQSKV